MAPDSSLSLFLLAGPPSLARWGRWFEGWSFSEQAEALGFSKEWAIIKVTTGQLGEEKQLSRPPDLPSPSFL